MRGNIDKRQRLLEQHEAVERTDLDYDDGEIVLIALCDKVDEDFERLVESLDLDIRSGPKWIGLGHEVMLA